MTRMTADDSAAFQDFRGAPATIAIFDAFAVVRSSCSEFVSSLLRARRLRYGAIEGRVTARRSSAAFFRQRESGELVVMTGSVSRIIEALQHRQIRVEVRDYRGEVPPRMPRQEEIGEQSARSQCLSGAVACSRGGVIVAASQSLRLRAVAEICRHFRDAKCLLPFASTGIGRAFAEGLLSLLPGQVGFVRGGTWCSNKRVVCCTLRSAESSEAADWDIRIYPDGDNVLTKLTFHSRTEFSRQLVFAIVSRRHRSAYERLLLEALAGPVIFETGISELPRVPVDAFGVLSPLVCTPSSSDALERKRILFWRNTARNSAVAEVAIGLANGEDEVLWRHGLFLDASASERRVAILVETNAHAQLLRSALPGWQLLHAVGEGSRFATSSRLPAWPSRSILTITRAEQMSSIDVDALVVACGGPPPVLPQCFPPTGDPANARPIVLVDFIDDFDPDCRAHSVERFHSYRDAGFNVRGAAALNELTSADPGWSPR
jgi:hypothetical protein